MTDVLFAVGGIVLIAWVVYAALLKPFAGWFARRFPLVIVEPDDREES